MMEEKRERGGEEKRERGGEEERERERGVH